MIIMHSGVNHGSDGFRGNACESWIMIIVTYKSLLSVLAGVQHVLYHRQEAEE
jgi:hypothetical protein